MTIKPLWDAATVEQAVAHLSINRPAYASILDFYGPVFTAQAKAAETTFPAAISVDESSIDMQREEGFAIIAPAAFTVDHSSAETLLAEICEIAMTCGDTLARAGKALNSAPKESGVLTALFRDVLDHSGYIRTFADKLKAAPDMLSLLLLLAIRPSIEAGARRLADLLTNEADHRSSCPICGSLPIIGELDSDGQLWIHCSLCWHRWLVKRMVCLFCTNSSSDSLEYLHSENEPEYRVNLCNACHHYLKVVDRRQLTRAFIAPLEQVVSMHLDMLVQERGFTHALGVDHRSG